ncbi:MAG: hypothetical protein LBI99_06120 [Propionibacteriaceae bacterium]|jgi:Arc/MetJ-type ribon-helix-helix transcriptional regulator|nr:hypothetical protein [Propionibacteriaceae bacterium]
MTDVNSPTTGKTRVTVDLPNDDYLMLRIAVAEAGKGVTLSSVVRELVHDYLERLQDDADQALAKKRKGSQTVLGQDVRDRFAQRRLSANG